MRLDNIKEKPETLWYEDEHGTRIPFDLNTGSLKLEYPHCVSYQHSERVAVIHSICTGYESPKWPIRFLKWAIRKMPNSWQGHNSQIASGESTIHCLYPIIKYLIENRDFTFDEACVTAANLCEDCMNKCLRELEGRDLSGFKHAETSCKYCEVIDPDHFEQRRVKGCYLAYCDGESVSEAYKNGRYFSTRGMAKEIRKENIFKRFLNYFRYRLFYRRLLKEKPI
jgi:hypothetical protein